MKLEISVNKSILVSHESFEKEHLDHIYLYPHSTNCLNK